MHPILFQLPGKALFVAILIAAVLAFAYQIWRWRQDPGTPRTATPLYLLGAAWLVMGLRGGAWIPVPAAFREPWLPVPLYAFGVMLAVSMIVGWFLALRLGRNDGVPQDRAAGIYLWTAVWAIVGARLLYVMVNFRTFDSPAEMLVISRGGMVAYGGMIGGLLASAWNCRRRGVPLLRWADAAAPSVALGAAITRMGCLLYGCDYGKRTALPWAIRFPRESPAWRNHVQNVGLSPDAAWSLPVHPTQIYETLLGLGLFGALMWFRRRRRFSGQVFVGWVLGYGMVRLIVEFLRDDDQRGAVGPFSTSQFIALSSVLLVALLLVSLVRQHRKDPVALRLWEPPAAGGINTPSFSDSDRRNSR